MPVVPASTQQPQAADGSGLVAVLRHALARLQERVNRDYPRLRGEGTCSRAFLDWLEELEREADRELVYRGFEKLPHPPARREARDLPIAYYRADSVIVEVGLVGLNRCGQLEALTGGEPPRVYARVYLGGRAAFVLEAPSEKASGLEAAPQSLYI